MNPECRKTFLPPLQSVFDLLSEEAEHHILHDKQHLHFIAMSEPSDRIGANVLAMTRNPGLFSAHMLVDDALVEPPHGVIGVYDSKSKTAQLDPEYVIKLIEQVVPKGDITIKHNPELASLARTPELAKILNHVNMTDEEAQRPLKKAKGKSKYTRKKSKRK
jgi:hypothetical protein